MKRIPFLVTLLFLTPALRSADEALPLATEEKVDPVVGRWNPTNTNIPLFLHADGSASDRSRKGKWECLTPEVTPRTYRITWERFLDTLLLVRGGNELVGENKDGIELRWIRMPAASEAAREFDQLTLHRDKELATAAEPNNRVYQTALETLQRRATLANDLETAARIKQALDRLSARVEIVGTWNFENHTDGVKAVVEFKPDNTFVWNGKQVGMWTTNDKQLVITHDNRGGHQDYYNLPVRDGKLDGTNTPHQKITITRKAE